jgi:hypothetical protein
MNVVLIFPITNNSENLPKILSEFKNEIAPKLTILGAESIEIKFAGTDYIFVGTNKTLEGQPKGEGVLECLKNCANPPDIVIVCDGSNAIPYHYIVSIFQELISDSGICCVMANRGENKSITEERFLIETFEIFILKKYHNHIKDISDGQCGLWGYRAGIFNINGCSKEIKLSAKSYEIELDLLSELLEKNLEYSFVNVVLPPRTAKSSFTYKNNLIKMEFLLNKYKKLKNLLPDYLKDFEEKNSDKISNIKNIWENYKRDLNNLLN